MRPCFSFRAATATAPAVLAIDDEIGFWGVQAKDFRESLNAISAKELHVEINSAGGDVFAGTAMFNMLRAWAKDGRQVVTKVSGVAASIASVVFLAGDKRVMPKNTFAMVHQPWTVVMGNADELRDQAETLDKIGGGMVKTYMDRTGLSEDEVKALLAQDTWISADEALEKGFATEIADEIKAKATFDMDRAELPEKVRAVFKAEEAPVDETLAEEIVVEETPADPLAEQIAAMAVKAELADFAPLWAVACTSLADAQAKISNAREIRALCDVVKKPELAASLIKDDKKIDEARAALADVLANEDEAAHTSNARKNEQQVTQQSAKSKVSPASLWASHQGQK
jgi:ATP-dependent protease ClpP protease subunit